MIDRRTVIRSAIKASVYATFAPLPGSFVAVTKTIALERSPSKPIPLPASFSGLGYEMSSVARIGLLSRKNVRYLQLVKQLGRRGVLRVGGIVADYTRYQASGVGAEDAHNTVITRESLEQFGGFLQELGWTAIWSLNFASGNLQDAMIEARAVAAALGKHLLAIELGNEVENYGRGTHPFRASTYSYEDYLREYREWHSALAREVPALHFAAPDTAGSVEWCEWMARDAPGDLQLLTTHYYRNGQKRGSAEQLMTADPNLLEKLQRMQHAAQTSGIPWRMCETNSFSGGGLPGVSDTLLGALWTLDFMLLLASQGCSGVNIETGVNQLGFVSSYSPIQDDGQGNNTAGAPYYGMLAFAAARENCTHSVALRSAGGTGDLTAYGLGVEDTIRTVVLINRGEKDLRVSLVERGFLNGTILRLAGSASTSGTGITFAGAPVDAATGSWTAGKRESLRGSAVSVPGMSAAVLRRG